MMCAMVKSRVLLGMGDLPPFNRNPYNGYINPYYWVDEHPLLYGNNGSLDPGTCDICLCCVTRREIPNAETEKCSAMSPNFRIPKKDSIKKLHFEETQHFKT